MVYHNDIMKPVLWDLDVSVTSGLIDLDRAIISNRFRVYQGSTTDLRRDISNGEKKNFGLGGGSRTGRTSPVHTYIHSRCFEAMRLINNTCKATFECILTPNTTP